MPLPPQLVTHSQSAFEHLLEHQSEAINAWPEPLVDDLKYVLGLSGFIGECLQRDSVLSSALPDMLKCDERAQGYRERLAELLSGCSDEMSGQRVLRQFRNREMTYIAWRDFMGSWQLELSLSHLSMLAEAMIFETYQWQYDICCKEWGIPCNEQGEAQPMLIIGMGKLGGGELNFSSDIDLIFTYPENGETQGARRSIANAQFSLA